MSMLLLMLVVAFAQALLRNLTNLGVAWANSALSWLDWSDFIISKGTLWLAFLGASLAVHADKHISIDIVPRLVSPRARIIMRGVTGLVGSVICFFLARAFWTAVLINGEELPPEFAVLGAEGNVHVCDATGELLASSGAHAPGPFCALRGLFRALDVKLETPGSAFQLIAPVMFVFMSVRMLGQGLHELLRVARGDTSDDLSAHGVAAVATDVAHDLERKGEQQ